MMYRWKLATNIIGSYTIIERLLLSVGGRCRGDNEYFDLQAKIFAVLNEYKTSNFRYNQIKGSTFLDTTH
jgi:hypothetical protein